jgi:hypothetical protein
MPVIDMLKVLEAGRELRGTVELDEYLLSWRAKFDGLRTITLTLDELSLDEPIPFLPSEPETEPGDFPL